MPLSNHPRSDEYQTFLVFMPVSQCWWHMVGVPSANPGTWDDCAIVADDPAIQKVSFRSLQEFGEWNSDHRRNPMVIASHPYGTNMYGTDTLIQED